MKERKRLGKMTQKELQDKLTSLRSRRGQLPTEAQKSRRHLARAEQRVVSEIDRRRKLRGENKRATGDSSTGSDGNA